MWQIMECYTNFHLIIYMNLKHNKVTKINPLVHKIRP